MSFNLLKKNSQNSVAAVQAELEKFGKKTYVDDSHEFWSPTVDKMGNGYAIVRFLPAPDGEDQPIVRYWDHSFERNGRWYINRSLTTFGYENADPVSEYNKALYDTGLEENIALVKGVDSKDPSQKIIGSKRRLHYVANIYVIQDKAKPENEDKCFKWRFGPKIYEMVQKAIKPQFEDQTPINPFDFWVGADFKVRIGKNIQGYRDYSQCQFADPSPLLGGDDDKLEALWNKQYSLFAEVDPNNKDKYKTYDELKRNLEYVVGKTEVPNVGAELNAPPTFGTGSSVQTATPKFARNNLKVDTSKETMNTEDFFSDLNKMDDDIPF